MNQWDKMWHSWSSTVFGENKVNLFWIGHRGWKTIQPIAFLKHLGTQSVIQILWANESVVLSGVWGYKVQWLLLSGLAAFKHQHTHPKFQFIAIKILIIFMIAYERCIFLHHGEPQLEAFSLIEVRADNMQLAFMWKL